MQRNADDRQRLLVRQEEEDDEERDEPMLGGGGTPFVPAFSAQAEGEYNIEDDRCLLEREHDEVVLMSSAPSSGAALTYCVFYLLGMGTMAPWNFFVTAEDVSRAIYLVFYKPASSSLSLDYKVHKFLRRFVRSSLSLFLSLTLCLCFLLLLLSF